MMNSRLAQKALAVPLLLIAAVLALTGCVAPPATVYPAQSPPGTISPQSYSTQPYDTQPGYAQPQYQPSYQQQYQPQYLATFCSAGSYSCPVPGNTPVGTSCACPGLGAPSYGTAR